MRLIYPTSVTLSRNLINALSRAPFRAILPGMHRLGPAAVVLIAALDASSAAADPNCTCRAPGRQVELGQTVCLMTPKGPRVATCAMVLNNTSWAFSESPCSLSDAAPLRPTQAKRASVSSANRSAALLR